MNLQHGAQDLDTRRPTHQLFTMDRTDLVSRVRIDLPASVTSQSKLALAIALPTAAVLIAEGFLYVGSVWSALLIHLFVFFGCLFGPLVTNIEATVFRAFLLVPLFRLLNFGMPVVFETTLSWLLVLYAGLLFATYIVARDQPEVTFPDRWNVRETFKYAPLAIVIAGVLATIEFVVLRPEALVESWTSLDFLVLVTVMVIFVGFGEEFLFRGVLQGTLAEHVGPFPAIAISALLFGAMHSGHGLLAEIGFGVATGLLLGFLYHRTSNLPLVSLIHGTLNVLLFGPFAF